jgi:putative transposase
MDIDKVSYSSSLGVQVAAVNFAVKYRHAIFVDSKVKRRAIESFRETEDVHGSRTGLKLWELGVDKDHVHLVLQWGPGASLSEIMRLLKGRSARDVLKDFPDLREKKFWGGHMWSPAYHFLTTGNADLKHHLEYVKSQGEPRRPLPGPGQMRLDAFAV